MAKFEGRDTVSILQACKEVGVSRRTIYNWLESGRIEYVRTAGGNVRIFTESLWRKGEWKPPRETRVKVELKTAEEVKTV